MAGSPIVRLKPQQEAAINARDVSVALSAGAGCGKTFVLTRRFLSHLDPEARDQRLGALIAITFTDRAAREMRDRIRAEVRKRVDSSTGDESKYWLDLLRRLHTARVSTIHGFCASLLRSHAAEAGLDPGFRVLDELEANNMLARAIEDDLQRRLGERHPAVMRLAVDFGLGRLRDMLAQLIRDRQQIHLEEWRGRDAAEVVQIWQAFHQAEVVPAALRQFAEYEHVATLLAVLGDEVPTNSLMIERRNALLRLLPKIAASSDPVADLQTIIECARVQGGGPKSQWSSETAYAAIRDACAKVRDKAADCREAIEWDGAGAEFAAAAGLDLLELALTARDAYLQTKTSAGALDYDDLLLRATQLLTSPAGAPLRRQFAASTELLMVDEFQDTDEVQVDLITALCDGDIESGKLFLVGDQKQSIYRFRGADPTVFRDIRERIPAAGRLPLSLNFRSQPAIIEFVNALFRDAIPDYEVLAADREQVTPAPAIEFLWAPAERSQEPTPDMRRREADWLARRLRQMIDDETPLVADGAGGARAVRMGDIAILFRALSDVEYYESALRNYELDYYLVGGHAFYSQQEVFDLVNLLSAVDSPADEVALAGALRSPFFSLPDEALFWLSQREGLAAGLFAAELPRGLEGESRERAQFARDAILRLRQLKDRLPVAALIGEALSATAYDAVLLAEFLGERKLANLHKLVDMARQFDRSGLFTLSDFITQLREFVVEQPREALAATQAEATNVIRMMTIHQAKGLEFPLVVVPDLDRRPNPSNSPVAFDRRLGPLVRLPESAPGGGSACGFTLLRHAETDEEAAETLRLFYVAATRSADYLLLSASPQFSGAPIHPWMKLLGKRFDLITGNPLCDLSKDAPRPLVRVTGEPPQLARGSKSRAPNLDELVDAASALPEARSESGVAPIPPRSDSRRRFSFSQLSGLLEPATALDWEHGEADSLGERAADPQRLGTIVHAVLAELDHSELNVAERVRHHAEIEFRDEPQLIAQASSLIERFLSSQRRRALLEAAEVHAEVEFILNWPPEGETGEGIILQGFIDCLYRDVSGWHIVDYKTNHVSGRQVAKAARAYELQMLLYGLAAERILGEPPQSLILHFLHPGAEIVLPFVPENRVRLDESIRLAIAGKKSGELFPV